MITRLSPALKREFFSLPNILTYVRVGFIPFILFFLFMSKPELSGRNSRTYCQVAFALFLLAALTDYLDGWLARTRNTVTLVGKFIDPVADKLIVIATLIVLVELQRIEAWIVVLIALREFSINALRILAVAEGLMISVVKTGKLKTAFQLCGILGLVLNYKYRIPFIWPEPIDFNAVGKVLLVTSLLFSLVSAITYFKGFVEAIKRKYEDRESHL